MIEQIQARLMALGYQWQENIFNDGKPNCMITITKCQNPHHFSRYRDSRCDCEDEVGRQFPLERGWGRFSRLEAWRLLKEWLQEHGE